MKIRRLICLLALLLLVIAAQAAQSADSVPAGPCSSNPRSGDFDFWIGSWDVSLASGQQVGRNEIAKAHGGCVLVEQWVGAQGGTGISLNYYDPANEQWVQNWVGSAGSLIDIRGGVENGSMLLEGTIQHVGEGKRNLFRGQWTLLDDGRVRQYFEESTDNGTTWQPWFEGFYTRRAADALNAG